jgi:hypothetical protein
VLSVKEFERLSGQLEDLNTSVEGIAIEVEALVAIHRVLAEHALGFDPLEDTDYERGGQ